MKQITKEYKLKGIAPVDNQLDLSSIPSGKKLSEAIYTADQELMDQVDGAIFNTDPFRRGTEMDAGTAFEVGYCKAKNLPLVGWQTETRKYPKLVKDYMKDTFNEKLVKTESNQKGATSGDLRDADGTLVHSAGCYQNLMIDMSIRKAGGKIYADPDWETAFRSAVGHLSKLMNTEVEGSHLETV